MRLKYVFKPILSMPYFDVVNSNNSAIFELFLEHNVITCFCCESELTWRDQYSQLCCLQNAKYVRMQLCLVHVPRKIRRTDDSFYKIRTPRKKLVTSVHLAHTTCCCSSFGMGQKRFFYRIGVTQLQCVYELLGSPDKHPCVAASSARSPPVFGLNKLMAK